VKVASTEGEPWRKVTFSRDRRRPSWHERFEEEFILLEGQVALWWDPSGAPSLPRTTAIELVCLVRVTRFHGNVLRNW
jgi:hypothetical protein